MNIRTERGLDFGKALYQLREKYKAKGKRMGGDGVSPMLDELDIPKSTAYFWINRYEESPL